jgi:hypothetical protein
LIETIKSDIRWYQPNTLWSWKRYHITHHSLQSLSGLSWLDAYQWATPFCCKIYLHKKNKWRVWIATNLFSKDIESFNRCSYICVMVVVLCLQKPCSSSGPIGFQNPCCI